jgi:hypothetical protein
MGSFNMRSQTLVFLCLTALAATPAAAQQQPQRMYKCVDAKGKTYYTQIPPPECLGRDTKELNKAGILKKSERAPSPAEVRAREEANKKKLEEDEKAREERRRAQALLATYPSERDIEDARRRALKEAEAAIVETEKRVANAHKRKKELESEKEFFVKKPLPAKLKQEITNNEIDIKNQTALLDAKKKEISAINAKYDDEKRRYAELTSKAAQKK